MKIPPDNAIVVQSYRPKKLTPGKHPTIPGRSLIVACDGDAFIKIGNDTWAVIDIGDIEKVAECTWTYVKAPNNRVYANNRVMGEDGKIIVRALHRIILDAQPGLYVDHIDCDGLNNRKINLRICTAGQNNCNSRIRSDNTSGYKGVSFRRDRKKWSAQITIKGRIHRLGCYESAGEAHAKYID